MSFVLGIDQSFTSTGIFVFERHQPKTCDILSTQKQEGEFDYFVRATEIADGVQAKLEEYYPTSVVLEGLGFAASGNQTRNLAGLQFVIMDRVIQFKKEKNPNMVIHIVAPTTLKKYATGNGKAKKDDMLSYMMAPFLDVWMKLKEVPASKGRSDLVDAFWLAQFGVKKELDAIRYLEQQEEKENAV